MASKIYPVDRVVTSEDPFAFEVELEQNQQTCTWMILDHDRHPIEHDVIRRVPGQEARSHFTFTHGPLEPGEYHLVLFDGEHDPDAVGFDFPPLDADNQYLLGEDSFAVVGPRVVNVHLMRDRDDRRAAAGPFADFREFLQLVEGRGGNGPRFGGGRYEQVRDAAREYVEDRAISDIDDLLPSRGYERGRQEALDDDFLELVADVGERALPAVELIWNYWQEEGMLVQTLNVILARFQNRRLPGRDPLARFDVAPLLPLRGLLWGFAEDETHRMTVRRRAAEYEYEYGLPLIGRAVPPRGANVERRSAFLESFHQVLHQAHVLFKEIDDLTISPDAFPLYQSLRDCHLVLSQGSHNQYGEMAVAARAEFLVMQYLLAQAPMREFLGGRPMTPYPETWMDRVDTMKSIQGWDDVSVMHYHDLAEVGERLVLTIRLGNWVPATAGHALTWATMFRPHIQRYVAAYRSVTGVDLARRPNAELPATLIRRRLLARRRGA